jgi:hypothetical protein
MLAGAAAAAILAGVVTIATMATAHGQPGAGGRAAPPGATSFTVTTPVRTLVVTTSPLGGDITITGSRRSTIAVTATVSPAGSAHLNRSLVKGTLTLGYTCSSTECGVAYTIAVPKGITVIATAERGRLTLSSLTGDVTAYTGTGNLTATNLGCRTASFRVDLGGLSVSYSSAPALLKADGSNAAITIRVPGDVAYDVHASGATRSTDIAVRRTRVAAHVIDVQAGAGPVKVLPS